jgi:hypothetical protein
MIIISARLNFWDDNKIALQDEIREITLVHMPAGR